MSQIASAYTVSAATLEKITAAAEKKQFDQFWQVVHDEGTEVVPDYGYSGYVVVLAESFLAEQGIGLLQHGSDPVAVRLAETELAPLVIVNHDEAAEAAAGVLSIAASDDELRGYYACERHSGSSIEP